MGNGGGPHLAKSEETTGRALASEEEKKKAE